MHPVAELSKVAQEFRHVQGEHEREGVEGSWRRRQGSRLDELERAFEVLLERWIKDGEEQARWRDHLYGGADEPEHHLSEEPPLFRGRSELGSNIVIVANGAERHVLVDGSLVDRWPQRRVIAAPVLHGESAFHEVFEAPPEALDALLRYLDDPGESPPWSWARELFEDGLIDPTFALTARGRRFHMSRRH